MFRRSSFFSTVERYLRSI